MKTALRIVITVVSAVSTLYFVGLVGGALLDSLGLPALISSAASLILAIVVARFVWSRTATIQTGLASAVVLGGLTAGGIGFSAGFFGPILFAPDANQGPLLGIFITGPLGFLLGAVGGAVYWFARRKPAGR